MDVCTSAAGARLGCGDGGMAAVTLRFWSRECGRSRRPSRVGQGCVFERLKRSACEGGTGSPLVCAVDGSILVARRVVAAGCGRKGTS